MDVSHSGPQFKYAAGTRLYLLAAASAHMATKVYVTSGS